MVIRAVYEFITKYTFVINVRTCVCFVAKLRISVYLYEKKKKKDFGERKMGRKSVSTTFCNIRQMKQFSSQVSIL